jgi:hypothetical protein
VHIAQKPKKKRRKIMSVFKSKANFLKWIKASGVRAIKTVAQTAVASIGTSMALGEVNWIFVGSSSLLAGVLSLLTSIAGLPEIKIEE